MAENDQNVPRTTTQQEFPPVPQGTPVMYFNPTKLETNEFEIGLVLGGTVSVGSYTAGVLDFLIEALDCWEKARKDLADRTPKHRVRLRIITGTSGGGVNAIIAARALHYRFPPARLNAPPQDLANNPFYDIWVNDISLEKLLKRQDLEGKPPKPVLSLLNGNVLTSIAQKGLTFPPPGSGILPIEPGQRSYLHNPLPVIVTQSNVTGVPYRQQYTSAKQSINAEYFSNHADYTRLYFDYPGSATHGQPELIGDGIGVYVPKGAWNIGPVQSANQNDHESADDLAGARGLGVLDWTVLGPFVLSTCAFPVGFPARKVSRNAGHYAYRFTWSSASGSYEWLTPVWASFVGPGQAAAFSFFSLDGGCTDNTPIALASQSVEGLEPLEPAARGEAPGTSEKGATRDDATDAAATRKTPPCPPWRALILVDPLCETPSLPLDGNEQPLLNTLGPMLDMFISSNRFETADMADFLHPEVYTRFLVAPKQTGLTQETSLLGAEALCGTGLGAFLGFAKRDFRHHDFYLGRSNCQAFLAATLTLPEDHPLFCDPKPVIPATYTGPRPDRELPIIPLLGNAAISEIPPMWPTGPLDFSKLKWPLRMRICAILRASERLFPHRNSGERLLFFLGNIWIAHKLTTLFLSTLTEACRQKKL